MISRERVYRPMSEDSDNSVMGLSSRARNHFVKYSAWVAGVEPFVQEMIDVHGEQAKKLIKGLPKGMHGQVLDIGEKYAVENRNQRFSVFDWYREKVHTHPDSI